MATSFDAADFAVTACSLEEVAVKSVLYLVTGRGSDQLFLLLSIARGGGLCISTP